MRRGAPIALFWFFYFGALGVFFPYYSLYLRENAGLSGTQVGLVMAAIPLTGLMAQPFWGNLADRLGARARLLVVLAAAAGAGYFAIGEVRGFPAILGATVAMACFGTAVIPLSVSVALAALSESGPHAFGLARIWGTLGYLITVAGFPSFLDLVATVESAGEGVSEPGLGVMFAVVAVGCVGAAAAGLWLPRDGAVRLRAERGDWRALLRSGPVVALLLVMFTSFLLLQGPMAMFPILVRARGGDLSTIGQLWIVMLALEMPLIASTGTVLQRFGARRLLAVGIFSGGLRWVACGVDTSLPVFYAVQILHGVTVTGLMVGGPLYLEQVVPERLRSTGQGLLAMLGVGAGGLLSNVATGWLLEHTAAEVPYLLGGAGALLLAASIRWILPKV